MRLSPILPLISRAMKVQHQLKALDLFSGLGGWSDGLALEGFDVLGVEIERKIAKLYKHKVIVADVRTLDGANFKGFDLIVGSPPCVDFSTASCPNKTRAGRTAPVPDKGLKLLKEFRRVVDEAQPTYWFMENVFRATKFYTKEKPALIFYTSIKGKRALWSNFTFPLMSDIRPKRRLGKDCQKFKWWKQSALKSRIPLPIARAIGKAVKEALT